MDGGHAPTLRVRASAFGKALAERTRDGVVLPTREELRSGDQVRIEVSFGPLADEVVLRARVSEPTRRIDGTRQAGVVFEEDQAEQLAYIEEVLTGGREAAARRHRRVPSRLPVVWELDTRAHLARLCDISRGGAFIRAEACPAIGDRVRLQLRLPREGAAPTIEVESEVRWIRNDRTEQGFGVHFRPDDTGTAMRLDAVVRQHEVAALAG